jgi:hypothetical protein
MKLTMQGIDGSLKALLQVSFFRLSLRSSLIGKLLSLCQISFKLRDFTG